MSFGLGDLFTQTCPACGATVGDAVLHQVFHESLSEVARQVFAPDLSADEWKAAIEEAKPAAEAVIAAERALQPERLRQALEEARARRRGSDE